MSGESFWDLRVMSRNIKSIRHVGLGAMRNRYRTAHHDHARRSTMINSQTLVTRLTTLKASVDSITRTILWNLPYPSPRMQLTE